MALTGTFERLLDDKNRIAVPKSLREGFSAASSADDGVTELYVAPGQDPSLELYAPAKFEALAQKFASHSPTEDEELTYKRRMFYSQAEKVELDGQGRIRIPERLTEHAQLKGELVLLGVQDHVEVWDKTEWTAYRARHSASNS